MLQQRRHDRLTRPADGGAVEIILPLDRMKSRWYQYHQHRPQQQQVGVDIAEMTSTLGTVAQQRGQIALAALEVAEQPRHIEPLPLDGASDYGFDMAVKVVDHRPGDLALLINGDQRRQLKDASPQWRVDRHGLADGHKREKKCR